MAAHPAAEASMAARGTASPMIRPELRQNAAPPWNDALDAAPPGSAALLLPLPPRGAALALHLLAEAAIQGGGRLASPPGHALLVGVPAAVAQRAGLALAAWLGGAAPAIHLLPDAAAGLQASLASAASPMGTEPACILLLDAAGTPRGQYLAVPPAPDHAADEAARRGLLAALADPSRRARLPALRPGLRLFLACPAEAPGGATPAGGRPDDPAAPVAVLPLAALWPAAAFIARAEGLRRAGWQPGLGGDDPDALDWMPGEGWRLAPPGARPPARLGPGLVLLGPRPDWAPPDALHAA
jgi:hypothetical protein